MMMERQGFWLGRRGNLVLLVLVVGFCAVTLEFTCRALPISDSMGWNRTPPLSERVKRFDSAAPEKIVALGDSFAEWRAGEGVNMFDLLQDNLADVGGKILNLSQAGTDVVDYTDAYHQYVRFQPDAIIMSLYLGNDVVNYQETSRLKGVDASALEDQRAGIKEFIKKHSTVINALFRIGKQHFAFMQAGTFDKTLKALQQGSGLSDAQVRERMGKLDPKIIELVRSDAINPWIMASGIVKPDYFKELFLESSQQGRGEAESTIELIRKFYQAQKVRNFLVVLTPSCLEVSKQYDDFFRRCGYDLDNFPLEQRRGLTRYLQRRLGELGIMSLDPIPALEKAYPAYIPIDEHLNVRGHKAMGEAMAQFVRKHFVWRPAAGQDSPNPPR